MSRPAISENLRRVALPEWEEFARAAWPGSVPLPLSRVAGQANFTVFFVGLLVQVFAAWAHLPWLALGAWTLAAALDWLSTRSDPATSRRMDATGLRPGVRGLLRSVLAAATIFAAAGPNAIDAALGYVTVVVAVQLAWLAQPMFATWVAGVAPVMQYRPRGLPQVRATRRHLQIYARGAGTPGALVGVEFGGLLSATIAASFPAGSQLSLLGLTLAIAFAETALLYLGWTAWQAFATRRDVAKYGRPLVEALTDLAPSYVVHLSFPARQTEYLVNQWLPPFDALPQQGMIVVREARLLADLEATRLPVIYAPQPRDLARVKLPSLKVAFYLGHGPADGQLQADQHLRHVLLSCGDSDKVTSVNNLARSFDEVWLAGPAGMERYRAAGIDLPPERCAVIGRPQVTDLPIGPTNNPKPVVLYAPTFEGFAGEPSYTSLDRMGVRLIRRLVKTHPELQVWFLPHPASGVQRESMLTAITEIATVLRQAGKGHRVVTDLSLNECLAQADVLISDISGVEADFLQTGRPILTCNPSTISTQEFVAKYSTQSGAYIVGHDLDGLEAGLAQALGEDRLHAVRAELKLRVLGELPNGPQEAFAANVARLTT